jgi:hypothetical protein
MRALEQQARPAEWMRFSTLASPFIAVRDLAHRSENGAFLLVLATTFHAMSRATGRKMPHKPHFFCTGYVAPWIRVFLESRSLAAESLTNNTPEQVCPREDLKDVA